jgi:hypothetical protein
MTSVLDPRTNLAAELGKMKRAQQQLVSRTVRLGQDIIQLERLLRAHGDIESERRSIADFCELLLRSEGRALSIHEMLPKLRSAGLVGPSNGHNSVWIALKRRADRFERVARGVYRLRGEM